MLRTCLLVDVPPTRTIAVRYHSMRGNAVSLKKAPHYPGTKLGDLTGRPRLVQPTPRLQLVQTLCKAQEPDSAAPSSNIEIEKSQMVNNELVLLLFQLVCSSSCMHCAVH